MICGKRLTLLLILVGCSIKKYKILIKNVLIIIDD